MDGRPLDILGRNGNRDDNEYKKELSEEALDEAERKRQQELKKKQDEIEALKEALDEAERKRQQELKKKQDEIQVLKQALDEAERKRQQDLKKKQDEIAELKSKHKEELRILENRMLEELKKIQAELESKIKENMGLEKELKIWVFDRSSFNVGRTMDFYSRLAQYLKADLPPSKITFKHEYSALGTWPPSHDPEARVPLSRVESVSSLPELWFNCIPSHSPNDFDRNNWRVIRCAVPFPADNPNVTRWILAYYDGNNYQTGIKVTGMTGNVVIPIPCPLQSLTNYRPLDVYNILGVGHRLSMYWGYSRLPGDSQ
ncbi:uncharacterized protein [Spinacia oleracea]|uniref:Uncharacterized protein n=1 Tax=Spinacia oleracea TaxID=3562 RepID=A0A9R0JSK1_SPIOL|nr:uncharacterized protein LOC110785311 [Spinacia oleracea]